MITFTDLDWYFQWLKTYNVFQLDPANNQVLHTNVYAATNVSLTDGLMKAIEPGNQTREMILLLFFSLALALGPHVVQWAFPLLAASMCSRKAKNPLEMKTKLMQ